jgi:hypothetical protein
MSERTIEPKHRLRIAITKNTKGYQHETTAEIEWHGSPLIGRALMIEQLREADVVAREEIRKREAADRAGN